MKHNLETTYGKKLPADYLRYLNNPETIEIIVPEHEDIEKYDNRYWILISEDELLEEMNMNNVGVAKNYECLKLFVKVYREFSEGDYTSSDNGNIALERIENSFIFAEENGDYLYFDPSDNYSIWIYYHDGGDVKKVSDSFSELLKL